MGGAGIRKYMVIPAPHTLALRPRVDVPLPCRWLLIDWNSIVQDRFEAQDPVEPHSGALFAAAQLRIVQHTPMQPYYLAREGVRIISRCNPFTGKCTELIIRRAINKSHRVCFDLNMSNRNIEHSEWNW